MRRSRLPVSLFAALVGLLLLAALPAAAAKPVDPCALLTKAEIQEAVGKPVEAGVLRPGATPAAGDTCHFTVAAYGSFDILIKPLQSYETPDNILAAFQKGKSKVEVLPNLGDKSFFLYPGYGMIQLNTFKAGRYILFTVLVPGATEAVEKAAAEKLMRKLLAKI
jgi:hypothetical protein